MITYRKTKRGEWVAYGPFSAFPEWNEKTTCLGVTVHKKDGTPNSETVTRLGKPFTVNGTEMVYGYLEERTRTPQRTASRCTTCRCHCEPNAGAPGSILFDGCDRCGCEVA